MQAFFESLHKVKQIFGHILLLSYLVLVAKIVNNRVQNRRRIYILLICVHKLNHQFLHVCCHFRASHLSLQCLQLILFELFFFLFSCLLTFESFYFRRNLIGNDVAANELQCHVWQEEESLDERIEIAGVANILQSDWSVLNSTSLV